MSSGAAGAESAKDASSPSSPGKVSGAKAPAEKGPEGKKPGEGSGKSGLASLKDALGTKGGGSKDAPLFIKSETLSLDSKGRIFTYRKNVQVQRDDLLITSDTMEGNYDEGNHIKTLLATGNVVITKGESLKAVSNRAIYYVPEAKIILTEAPELYRNGNALAADKVTIFVNEDRSEAEGNVRVKVLKDAQTGVPAGG